MKNESNLGLTLLGIFIFLGLITTGYFFGNTLEKIKQMDRIVSVKGLAEQEVKANIVVWPIEFRVTGNQLEDIYTQIEKDNEKITSFLKEYGINDSEITISAPTIEDKMIYQSNDFNIPFRYIATQTITVYSSKVDIVYTLSNKIGTLVKDNIALNNSYQPDKQINYIFTHLNELKPKMIEESTKNAREVAEKFAKDSNSSLGKIKKANQGQFSIENRDQHNPQIKKIRVVSTVEYYLTD